MRPAYPNVVSTLFCFFYSLAVPAQLNSNDSLFYSQSIDSFRTVYKTAMKEDLRVYTGTQYLQFGGKAKGFAFFESPDFMRGEILYDNNLYTGINMRYDLEKDMIMVESYSNNYSIQLLPERVGYFRLGHHLFSRFTTDSSSGSAALPGFFDKIYSAQNLAGLVKREKRLEMPVSTEDNVPEYKQYDTWYISANGKYYKVDNPSSIPGILEDKKSALRKFIRANHYSRKKMTDDLFTEILAYYTSLKQE